MLDLIGFWFNVSVLTAVASILPLFILFLLFRHMICKIAGEDKGDLIAAKVCHFQKDVYFLSASSIYRGYSGIQTEGAKYVLTDGWRVVYVISTVFFWIFASIFVCAPNNEIDSLLTLVSIASTTLAPYTGGIGVFLVVYFLAIYLGRKLYAMSERVNAIISKVEGNS